MQELKLLGGLDLTGSDGGPAISTLAHPKSMALLAFLALAPQGRFLSRDTILAVFWPESDEKRARNALSQSLHILRSEIESGAILNRGRNGIHLNHDLVRCDAAAFLRAIDAGDHAEALRLYSGDLLEGFHLSGETRFEAWAEKERLRFREQAARSAWNVARDHIRGRRLTDAERTGQRALELVLTDEDEVRKFISALAGAGGRAAAVGFYERFAGRLQEVLELQPDPSTQALVGEIRAWGSGSARSSEKREDQPRSSIAALPWINRSGREEDLYFTDGLHEEIIGRLSQIGGLRVISRPSVMKFRDSNQEPAEIAAELGVGYLLTAGLMRARERVRINVQLMDGGTEQLLWAETYEHGLSMENLLSVQAEIARHVVMAMEAVLTPEEEERIRTPVTENLEAYDLYLLGRHRWVTRSSKKLRESILYFEAATERDPKFALAWTGIADAWIALPWYEPIPAVDAHRRARKATERALSLNPDLAEVHTALGGQAFYFEWEWEKAEGHLRKALEINPNYAQAYQWLSMVEAVLGRFDDAIRSIRRGIALNPLGNNFHGSLAAYLYTSGRREEALAVYRITEGFNPPTPNDLLCMSISLTHEGITQEADRVIRRWGAMVGYSQPERLPVVLRAFRSRDHVSEALEVLADLKKRTGLQAGLLAILYLNLPAAEEALQVAREAIHQRHATVPFFSFTPLVRQVAVNRELAAAFSKAGIPIHSVPWV